MSMFSICVIHSIELCIHRPKTSSEHYLLILQLLYGDEALSTRYQWQVCQQTVRDWTSGTEGYGFHFQRIAWKKN